jgi:hypothetical protein
MTSVSVLLGYLPDDSGISKGQMTTIKNALADECVFSRYDYETKSRVNTDPLQVEPIASLQRRLSRVDYLGSKSIAVIMIAARQWRTGTVPVASMKHPMNGPWYEFAF